MTQVAKERLYLTRDRKALVLADDKRAGSLYAVPGDEIPDSAAERFGLVGGLTKASAAVAKRAGADAKATAEKVAADAKAAEEKAAAEKAAADAKAAEEKEAAAQDNKNGRAGENK
ncbi:hypothetical protein [Nitratireductor soli]|uniref:hypothetical protein n=1 Tax=Nitratireductor soli TaxID=1670619 RepID=UPI00065E40FA|nr:hypothetical protein [Nitratireductor soli]